jgi:hypothetical protein
MTARVNADAFGGLRRLIIAIVQKFTTFCNAWSDNVASRDFNRLLIEPADAARQKADNYTTYIVVLTSHHC